MPEDVTWKGSLVIEDYAACWTGAVGSPRTHRHFAAQAVLSDDPIEVRCGDTVVEGTCILIEPNAQHSHSSSAKVELHFLEPDARVGIADDLRRRLNAISPVLVTDKLSIPFWTGWLDGPRPKEADVRIARCIDAFDERIMRGPVRIGDFAQASGLSQGRFRHLFAAEMGIPFKRYVLWRRLRLAVRALVAGANVTDAAHAAGFADSAHFSRTLKAMFGTHAMALFHRTRPK